MVEHYITLGGQRYRAEVNWNTFERFAALKRIPISEVLKFRLDEGDNLKVMLTASIMEGERIEGREFKLTPMQVGEVLNAEAIGEFYKIFMAQYASGDKEEQEEEAQPAKKKGILRKRS